jgi:hypothetical protein
VHAQRLDVLVAAGGWQVVRPELLSIVDQLELLATASRVAGEEGSALHLMALLSDVRGLRVDVICRRPDRPAAEQNQNYQTIATAKGIEQRLHVIPEEHVLAATYGHVRKVATTLAGHLEALDIARTPGTADTGAERLAATLVAELAADRRVGSLLDLGSSGGGRILRAGDGTKVDAVREAFAGDPRHLADGIGRYEMPPTEFLELAGSLQLRYDVIVIEGPWGAGELVELWIRSQAVATDDAAWVLRGADDAATQEAAMLAAERRMAGSAALAERAGRTWLLAGETGRD